MDADNLKYCNCAVCGAELLGDSPDNRAAAAKFYTGRPAPAMVAGRVNGRPRCVVCMDPPKPPRKSKPRKSAKAAEEDE